MSSRNAYLSPDERQAAVVLSRALGAAEESWKSGERRGDALRETLRRTVAQEPLARLDYASAADPASFEEVGHASGPVLLLLAAWLGRTRLIDNRRLE
jgi:pantoate--beta-alanine ligase